MKPRKSHPFKDIWKDIHSLNTSFSLFVIKIFFSCGANPPLPKAFSGNKCRRTFVQSLTSFLSALTLQKVSQFCLMNIRSISTCRFVDGLSYFSSQQQLPNQRDHTEDTLQKCRYYVAWNFTPSCGVRRDG